MLGPSSIVTTDGNDEAIDLLDEVLTGMEKKLDFY